MAQSEEHMVQKIIQTDPGWYLQLRTHQVKQDYGFK